MNWGRWTRGSSWVPRRTVRLRLTALYGALFLACGAGLLFITYLLVAHRLPTYIGQRAVNATPGNTVVAIQGSFGGAACKVTSARMPALPGPAGSGPLTLPDPSGTGAATDRNLQREVQQCLAAQQDTELNQLLTESGTARTRCPAAGSRSMQVSRARRPGAASHRSAAFAVASHGT